MIDCLVSFWQEYQTNKAIVDLNDMLAESSWIIRDGTEQKVDH